MRSYHPRQIGQAPGGDGAYRTLAVLTVAALASLTALGLGLGLSGRPELAAGVTLALLLAQAVAFGACLLAACTLLRGRDRVTAGAGGDGSDPVLNTSGGPPAGEPLEDRRWLGLVEALAGLLGELEKHRPYLRLSASDLAEHVDLRVQEILERSGVTVISGDTAFDRNRHQPDPPAAHARPGTPVAETLRPGLAFGRRVFRRARVRLVDGGALKADNSPPGKAGPDS